MTKEIEYSTTTDPAHIRKYGQYFTDPDVAGFMVAWACREAGNLLDPAAGNSVFLKCAKRIAPTCDLYGYEIDPDMLEFFGNPSGAVLKNEDYLLTGWEERYDAIVCNPPYNRFQAVTNRERILEEIERHTGVRYSSYTNLYILFLLKSLFQLSEQGRLAYIIPTEFLNSKYGTVIKEKLIRERLLRAVICFRRDKDLFYHATTTCCILLIDREPKSSACFYGLDSAEQLKRLKTDGSTAGDMISYDELKPDRKWREFFDPEPHEEYMNLRQVSDFCSVSRGIATGSNAFFCLSKSKIADRGLPEDLITPCICRSVDVKGPVLTKADFDRLAEEGRTVYLLDIRDEKHPAVKAYIREGEEMGINRKYLVSRRNPWYSMEQRPVAPIWVSSACRKRIKFVRNLAGVSALTTFHSILVHPEYEQDTDILFCYFLTPVAQEILRRNRKEMGNGLDKFQPRDLETAKMLDITILSAEERREILGLYDRIIPGEVDPCIARLDRIFRRKLTAEDSGHT